MFFKYLRYNLKASLLRTIVTALIATLFMLIILPELTQPRTIQEIVSTTGKTEIKEIITYKYCKTGMKQLTVILAILSAGMPVICLSDFKKRRNLDTLYSLSLNRSKLSFAHFLSGFIQTVLIYSCAFFTTYIFLKLNTNIFDLKYMLLFYPVSIAAAFLIYSFVSFLYSKGNTVVDGVSICMLWIMVLDLFVTNLIIPMLPYKGIHYRTELWDSIFDPLNNSGILFTTKCEINQGESSYFSVISNSSYMFILWIIIGILCFAGFLITSSKHKANHAQEISNSIFGYKLLIPLFGILVCIDDTLTDVITTAIIMYMLYIVYRRSFKLKKHDYIILASTFLLTVIIYKFI